jgi:AbrB family looped-hinge helix DNA binding protein
MSSTPLLVRVGDKGQVTLPAALRERLGIKKGDLVVLLDTPDGILITPQAVAVNDVLDRMGAALHEQGVTLEDLIDSGRSIREEIVRELYDIDATE